MAAKPPATRVYLDTCPIISVIKQEPGLWKEGLKVLLAMDRGDIQIVASTLLLVELSGYNGALKEADQDSMIDRFLRQSKIHWVEVDVSIASEARKLAKKHLLRGADATHLATALRYEAEYFMSRDKRFPYGEKIGTTKIIYPSVVWNTTIDDAQIDNHAD
ncbi:type II toxin-antitoxin system VapC family toxin [Paenarthrobacter sp. NPDC089322]|uniref:type II toxin-antitoxin system VapC family toxin n=1 Tax=Paenarthrobacter sp. NPDC089322 TaxID=3155065 RepID=UPI0034298F1F